MLIAIFLGTLAQAMVCTDGVDQVRVLETSQGTTLHFADSRPRPIRAALAATKDHGVYTAEPKRRFRDLRLWAKSYFGYRMGQVLRLELWPFSTEEGTFAFLTYHLRSLSSHEVLLFCDPSPRD